MNRMSAMVAPMTDPFSAVIGGHTLAQAVVNTIREPLLVLDADMRVLAASRSFYDTFRLRRSDVQDRLIKGLGTGQWDVPGLQALLKRVLAGAGGMETSEVEMDVPSLGLRTVLMNARAVTFEADAPQMILLAMQDMTPWRTAQIDMQNVVRENEILMQEMQHRVANSLQIIASILLLKTRTVQSEETRHHLQDAHQRVMSVVAVQEQLRATRDGENVEVGPYLKRLTAALAASMIGAERRIAVTVDAANGDMRSSDAVSLGLLVTELLLNAIKHAFPDPSFEGEIAVAYETDGPSWTLTVSDNGVGWQPKPDGKPATGLGASIIDAVATKLDAVVERTTGPEGSRIAIRHVTIAFAPPAATG